MVVVAGAGVLFPFVWTAVATACSTGGIVAPCLLVAAKPRPPTLSIGDRGGERAGWFSVHQSSLTTSPGISRRRHVLHNYLGTDQLRRIGVAPKALITPPHGSSSFPGSTNWAGASTARIGYHQSQAHLLQLFKTYCSYSMKLSWIVILAFCWFDAGPRQLGYFFLAILGRM